MSNDLKLGLSINLKRAIIRVHKNTLRILGNPEYIVLCINPDDKTLVISPSTSTDPRAHKISRYNLLHNKTLELYSSKLIKDLCLLGLNWTSERTYKIFGYKVEEYNVIKFKLEEAIDINK